VRIVCPTCGAVYNLPAQRVPSGRVVAKCKRCEGAIIIDPADRSAGDGSASSDVGASHYDRPSERPPLSANAARTSTIDPLMDLAAFIGPKADKYLDTFKRFEKADRTHFTPTWHWPAALVGFWWLLYRKLYLWALAAMVVAFIPLANLVAMVGFGLGANYLYYRHAQKKVGELRTALPDANLLITLKQIGGVNRWAMVLGVVLGGLGTVGMLASVI